MAQKRSNIRSILALSLILLTIFGVRSGQGCSIGKYPVTNDPDHVILIGRVSAYRDQLVDDDPSIGLEVEPVIVFGESDRRSLAGLIVVPVQLGISCEPVGLNPSRVNLEQYAIGKLLGLHVGLYTAEDSSVMYGLPHFSLEDIHDSCELQAVANPHGDWKIPRQCGSSYFHAKALAAALSTSSLDEIDQSLRRLAIYPGAIKYEELVNRFVPNIAERKELLAARYGDITRESCSNTYDDAPMNDRARFLYREFCAFSQEARRESSTNEGYE